MSDKRAWGHVALPTAWEQNCSRCGKPVDQFLYEAKHTDMGICIQCAGEAIDRDYAAADGVAYLEERVRELESENAKVRERLVTANEVIDDCWRQWAYDSTNPDDQTNGNEGKWAGGLSLLEDIEAWRREVKDA